MYTVEVNSKSVEFQLFRFYWELKSGTLIKETKGEVGGSTNPIFETKVGIENIKRVRIVN